METNYEVDDDTHYCIKCHLTVNGLDNYVRHRQTGCRPSEAKRTLTPDPPTPAVSYPEILNADAFFSSLELQSSAKSKSRGTPALLEQEKKSGRSGEKRRRSRRYQEIDVPSPRDKLITLPPVVTDLDDPTDHIGIPSLVGFPDIVTFTEKSSTAKLQPLTISKPIQCEKKPNEDDREWLNDDLEDSDGNKAGGTDAGDGSDSDTDYDYQHDDGSDIESPVEDIGQDSYTDTDDPDDREYPPQAHIGGKWKPDQLLHDIVRHHDDELDQEELDHHSSHIPAHSGGKWKPAEKTEEDEPAEDEKEDDDRDSVVTRNSRQPPPGHTRGKWIPGTSTVPSEVGSGYWCSPCGRKLASKLVYNRHLRSDLHARRCIQEIEGDVKLPRSVGPLLRKKFRSKRQKTLEMKRTEIKKTIKKHNPTKKTRHREKEVLQCEMCHARVRRPQLGKHLLSHYHCRVAGLNPYSPTARRFILENMGNVVRQCPFQCSGCRFYCNTEETFLLHWRSSLHANTWKDDKSYYICACCNFLCDSDAIMEQHLLSLEHRETIAVISGSVPIVIRRQRVLSCKTCGRRFRYNVQLRFHAKDTGHSQSWTATDDYQQKIFCNLCPKVLRSQLSLQRHQLTCHKSGDSKDKISAPYFCSFCSINFETAWDAVLHRRTTSHKQTVKEHKFGSDEVSSLRRDCGHCGENQSNLTEHKQHLLQRHPDLCHKCLTCGEIFPLSQDVTRHTKIGECQKKNEAVNNQFLSNQDKRRCTQCSFMTASQAELIFHQAIHAGSIEHDPKMPSSSKTSVKYGCPICDKTFSKKSLRHHIRQHTGEKPFSCSKCLKCFARRSTLTAHANQCYSSCAFKEKGPEVQSNEKIRRRNYICLECNTGFYTKDNLRQHMLRHVGKSYKCGLPGCPTILRTETELKAHRALIHESGATDRQFQCNECSYAAKTKTQLRRHYTRHKSLTSETQLSCPHKDCSFVTKLGSHLKRHMRLHTGIKPYKCPHCSYASNNIENLRKHVLSTGFHPSKMIYECDKCKCYSTNFSKELRAHLMEKHSKEFPTPSHATSYVAGILGSDGHTTQPE